MDPAPLLLQLLRAAAEGPEGVLRALDAPLRALGFAPRATQAKPGAVLWTRGRARIVLSGHVDVVPVGEGWTLDARGEEAEHRVWGRGACDMLGSVACFVAAAARTDAPCAILLTTDEETGMKAAEHALAEGLLDGFEACVVGEPTSFEVGIAEKGVLWLRVTARGRNAHGSMPHLGDNAAERLVRVLSRLQAVRLDGEHALLGRATLNLGTLRAGEAVNQVPASAVAELDVRYLPGMRAADLVRRLDDAAGEPMEFEVLSDHRPFEVAPDAPLARAAVRATGRRALGLPYGTEASKYAPAGLPCVILGPGDPALAHTSREHIGTRALAEGAEVYARLIEAYR